MAELSTAIRHPIMGTRKATLEQMIAFVNKVNPRFQSQIAQWYIQVGDKYSICGDVALCQAINETNWFRFGGDVQASQNNFAGLGASGGVQGSSFHTIEEGVTAHIQHLFAYATVGPIPTGERVVDPRFQLVARGSAPNWEDLAGKWAVPGYDKNKYDSLQAALQAGATYGQKILGIHQQLLQIPVVEQPPAAETGGYPAGTEEWKKSAVEWMYEQGLLTSNEWKGKINEPLPLWVKALILERLDAKRSGDEV